MVKRFSNLNLVFNIYLLNFRRVLCSKLYDKSDFFLTLQSYICCEIKVNFFITDMRNCLSNLPLFNIIKYLAFVKQVVCLKNTTRTCLWENWSVTTERINILYFNTIVLLVVKILQNDNQIFFMKFNRKMFSIYMENLIQ